MNNGQNYMNYLAWGGVGVGAVTATVGIARDSKPAIVAGGVLAGVSAIFLAREVVAEEPPPEGAEIRQFYFTKA